MLKPYLKVAASPGKGWGVFTSEDIPVGVVIEVSPVLVLNKKECKHAQQTILSEYIFNWKPDSGMACVALGFLSLYNHSYSSNCTYTVDYENKLMGIVTVKPVKKGDELFINYNAESENKTPVWFHEKMQLG